MTDNVNVMNSDIRLSFLFFCCDASDLAEFNYIILSSSVDDVTNANVARNIIAIRKVNSTWVLSIIIYNSCLLITIWKW